MMTGKCQEEKHCMPTNCNEQPGSPYQTSVCTLRPTGINKTGPPEAYPKQILGLQKSNQEKMLERETLHTNKLQGTAR